MCIREVYMCVYMCVCARERDGYTCECVREREGGLRVCERGIRVHLGSSPWDRTGQNSPLYNLYIFTGY